MYRIHGFFTQNTMKTLYVAEELGIDYEFHFVDLLQGENRADSFLQLNPLGKVPVLEHDGEFLWESGAICRYLANVENSALYPGDKLERARVDQWMDYFSCHLGRWLSTLYFEQIIKPKANLGEPGEAACEEAAKFATQQLKFLDAWLANSARLTGERLSIADLFAFAYLEQVHALGFSLESYPRVKAWLDRMEARPGIRRARERVQEYSRSE